MFDFVQEMGDLKLALYGAGTITHYISLLVLICDAKTWSPKKENKTVSDPGLSYLCADWVFDFVQEMGDWKLALQGVGVTQNISSLVLICDAKTWSPPPKKKWNCFGPWTVLCADQVFNFVQEMLCFVFYFNTEFKEEWDI